MRIRTKFIFGVCRTILFGSRMDFQRLCGPFHKFSLLCILILIICQYESVTYWTTIWKNKFRVKSSNQKMFTSTRRSKIESQNAVTNKYVQEVNLLKEKLKLEDSAQTDTEFDDYEMETVDANDETNFNDSIDSDYKELEEVHYRNVATVDIGPDLINDSQTLIVLFTSWAYKAEKLKMHETLLSLWSSWLLSTVHPLVLTNDVKVQKMAIASNWSVLPVVKTFPMCKGPPVLRNLFLDTEKKHDALFYGFANADIIFGDGLVRTLKYLRNNYRWTNSPLLIVGRRYNYDFKNLHPNLTHSSQVRSLLKNGKLVMRSTDYFFTNKAFPWKDIPMVSIGRPFVVRAIIGYALKHRYDIIDATRTIESVHLTTADGIYASWNKPGKNCNSFLLMKRHYKLPLNYGHCECARLETVRDKKGHIHLRSRKPSRVICPGKKECERSSSKSIQLVSVDLLLYHCHRHYQHHHYH